MSKLIIGMLAFFIALAGGRYCPKYDTTQTNGVGRRTVPSTIATITLSVEKEGPSPTATQRRIARTTTRLLKYLRGQRVLKLRTLGVSLFPLYTFRNNIRTLRAYRGSNTISFEVSVPRAGTLLDGGVRNGATRIGSVSFSAAPAAARRARKAAVRAAVRMARFEARCATREAGVQLGRALRIQVTDSFFPTARNVHRFTRMRNIARETSTPIEAGEQTITARVTVTFHTYEDEEKMGASDMLKKSAAANGADASGMSSKKGSKYSY